MKKNISSVEYRVKEIIRILIFLWLATRMGFPFWMCTKGCISQIIFKN